MYYDFDVQMSKVKVTGPQSAKWRSNSCRELYTLSIAQL